MLFGRGTNYRRLLESVHWHDWQADPFARGAYSFLLAGGGRARKQLAQSIDDTLFFAGEATDAVCLAPWRSWRETPKQTRAVRALAPEPEFLTKYTENTHITEQKLIHPRPTSVFAVCSV